MPPKKPHHPNPQQPKKANNSGKNQTVAGHQNTQFGLHEGAEATSAGPGSGRTGVNTKPSTKKPNYKQQKHVEHPQPLLPTPHSQPEVNNDVRTCVSDVGFTKQSFQHQNINKSAANNSNLQISSKQNPVKKVFQQTNINKNAPSNSNLQISSKQNTVKKVFQHTNINKNAPSNSNLQVFPEQNTIKPAFQHPNVNKNAPNNSNFQVFTKHNTIKQTFQHANIKHAPNSSNFQVFTKQNAASTIIQDNVGHANVTTNATSKNYKLHAVQKYNASGMVTQMQHYNKKPQGPKPKIIFTQLCNQKQQPKHETETKYFTKSEDAVCSPDAKNQQPNLSFKNSIDGKQKKPKNKKRVKAKKKSVKPSDSNPGCSNLLLFKREPLKSGINISEFEDLEEEDDSKSEVSSFSVTGSDSESSGNTDEENSVESEEVNEYPMQLDIQLEKSISIESEVLSSNQESYISVFWDIENCPVPVKKSATDFVQKIRELFYEGRTEKDFIIACDVSNLNLVTQRELSENSVTVIHVSSLNKNAADAKLQSCLLNFQTDYRNSKSAIVLISADSDFSAMLNDMRYKHHICINLLCKKNTRTALVKTAHKYIYYEDFIEQIPDKLEEAECIIVATNVPTIEIKRIKNTFSQIIFNLNARIKNICPPEVEIIFSNQAVLEKALKLLQGLVIEGNQIEFETPNLSKRKKKKAKQVDNKIPVQNMAENSSKESAVQEVSPAVASMQNAAENASQKSVVQQGGTSEQGTAKQEEQDNVSSGNKATLVCIASYNRNDVEFWTQKFAESWEGEKEFTVEWQTGVNEGVFLVHFKSLKRARKVKKLIMTKQETDPMAPKFLKLIKHSDICPGNETDFSFNNSEIKQRKVEEHVNIIMSKRNQSIEQQKEMVNSLKKIKAVFTGDSAETVNVQLQKMNEQKVTFLNFTENTLKLLKAVDIASENFEKILNSILHEYSRECACFTNALPIYARKTVITNAVKKYPVTIICAEPGSGKSSQISQYIWRSNEFCNGLIVCTQPRKLSVMLLARYVSSQVGCTLGDIVGYKVGLQTKQSANTQILYVTDYTLLQMMINNPELDKVSCVIVDEAQERTIYTDLLLGILKRCLILRTDLKVVITSTAMDVSIFKDYFNVSNNSVLQLSGKLFPVEDKWLENDIQPGYDSLDNIVSKVYDIIVNEDIGDVLVFLTTPLETEKAAEMLFDQLKQNQIKKVSVFYLHDELDIQEQHKMFDKLPDGSRKVVFCTNCAETSVTIPGIKYIVDCGMMKDSQYYPESCTSILSFNFISCSSADQRRGCAGRTQPGKCFRMYSQANYERDMPENTKPEILGANLAQTLLKLLKLGFKDPLGFNFIQSPKPESLVAAVKQLVHLGAIDSDLVLSKVGEQMASLPLEPRLSHLIFSGISEGVGYETVVLAALVTMSHNISFCSEKNDDAKMLRFRRNQSDFLTYLEVFKEWLEVPKSSKSNWCEMNCINAKSMKMAHEFINELSEIIRKELNFKMKIKFNEGTQEKLLEVIFNSFSQNLCYYSGHPRFGYLSAYFPEKLMLPPNSSVHSFGKVNPPYLVYDTILQSTKMFVVNVSPVTEELVAEADDAGKLTVDISRLNDSVLVPQSIKPIGKSVLEKSIGGRKSEKLQGLLKSLKELCPDFAELERNIIRGEIIVYSPKKDHQMILDVIIPMIEETKDEFLAEYYVVPNMCGYNGLTAILHAGAELKDILLPNEFKDVKITLKNSDINSAVEYLERFGPIHTVKQYENYFKVSFLSPIDAKRALTVYQDNNLFTMESDLKADKQDHAEFYKVLVKVLRRPCFGEAYMSIEPASSMPETMSYLLKEPVIYKGESLKFEVSKKSTDIRIINLPQDVNNKGLKELLKSVIPAGVEISKLLVVRKKPFESTGEEFTLQSNILRLFSKFARSEDIAINLPAPSSADITWDIFVYFKDPHDGVNAVASLKSQKYIDKIPFEMKPVLEVILHCKLDVFSAVRDEIAEALKFFHKSTNESNMLEIECKMEKGDIQIHITSNNIADIIDARNCIMKHLQGEQIKCSGDPIKEKLFTHSGLLFLKKLQQSDADVNIQYNMHSKVIYLFGTQPKRSIVNIKINGFLEQFKKESLKEISLLTSSGKKGALKVLLMKYDPDLSKLKEACGQLEMNTDIRNQIISLKGSPKAINECKQRIEQAQCEVDGNCSEEDLDSEACPMCDNVIDTMDLNHRLEYCGHAYCRECLLHVFHYASTFPLECLACNSPIAFADIRWAYKEIKTLKLELYNRVLKNFITTREDIQCCPTPACAMVFRVVNDEPDCFCCPSCNNAICNRCCVPYHYGMSCSLFQCYNDGADNALLRPWLEADPRRRKLCPSCNAPIEKNSVCNHMTCWKCKTLMCWRCLGIFPSGDHVYLHQPQCTGRA